MDEGAVESVRTEVGVHVVQASMEAVRLVEGNALREGLEVTNDGAGALYVRYEDELGRKKTVRVASRGTVVLCAKECKGEVMGIWAMEASGRAIVKEVVKFKVP